MIISSQSFHEIERSEYIEPELTLTVVMSDFAAHELEMDVFEAVLKSDSEHDLRFEKYLSTIGYRSVHRLLFNIATEVRDRARDTNAASSADSSYDTSGEYGDDPRLDIFPGSTETVNAQDLERTSFQSETSLPRRRGRSSAMTRGIRNEFASRNWTRFDSLDTIDDDDDDAFQVPSDYEVDDYGVESDEAPVYEDSDSEDEDSSMSNPFRDWYSRSRLFDHPSYFWEIKCYRINLTGGVFRPNDYLYFKTDKTKMPNMQEMVKISDRKADYGIPLNTIDASHNYRRYTHDNQLHYRNADKILQSSNPMFALQNQPREKFPLETTLDVQPLAQARLTIPRDLNGGMSDHFRSNLSTIYCKNGKRVLFVATGAQLLIYDIAIMGNKILRPRVTSIPANGPRLLGGITLKCTNPSAYQYREAVHPHEPFSINYITTGGFTFSGLTTDYIAVGNDFSQIIVLDIEELLGAMLNEPKELSEDERKSLDRRLMSNSFNVIFEAVSSLHGRFVFFSKNPIIDCIYASSSSVWCIKSHKNKMFVSDNSQKVHVFFFTDITERRRFGPGESSQMLDHNIPYIDIADFGEDDVTADVICCGTYSSTLYILDYEHRRGIKYRDSLQLDGPVWSCHFIPKSAFQKVESIQELSGDMFKSDEDLEDATISSTVLKGTRFDTENGKQFDVGISEYIKHTSVPSLKSRKFTSNDKMDNKYLTKKPFGFCTLRRIRELYDISYLMSVRLQFGEEYPKYTNKLAESFPETGAFLFATTDTSAGLLTVLNMINISTCKNVFPIIDNPQIVERSNVTDIDPRFSDFVTYRSNAQNDHILPESMRFLNRIYLTVPMFSINAMAIATQAGQVAIVRFTDYSGLKSFRLEWVLIDSERYVMSRTGSINTIIGMTGHVTGHDDNGDPIWTLLVVYSDMMMLGYTVRREKTTSEGGSDRILALDI